jgi:hypothetical protein
MFDEVIWKHSAVDLDFDMDFSGEVPSGDSIASQTVTAVDSAGVDASAAVVNTSSVSGTDVRARLQAGTDMQDYRVTFTAVMTTSTENRVKVLLMKVRDNRIG